MKINVSRPASLVVWSAVLALSLFPRISSGELLEQPQRQIYQLSCMFIPNAGTIKLDLTPDSENPDIIKARVDVKFSGLVGRLSGSRTQHYTSILVNNPATGLSGMQHRQEIEVNHSGERIRYAWEWWRDIGEGDFVARRYWGGEQKEVTRLNGGSEVVSDILSLIVRVGALAHARQSLPDKCEYALLDPEGNIRVYTQFREVTGEELPFTRVRLDFSRAPLTLGASMLELWFNQAGEIVRGRIAGIGGLLPLNFSPIK
jgi:hypothetical protein